MFQLENNVTTLAVEAFVTMNTQDLLPFIMGNSAARSVPLSDLPVSLDGTKSLRVVLCPLDGPGDVLVAVADVVRSALCASSFKVQRTPLGHGLTTPGSNGAWIGNTFATFVLSLEFPTALGVGGRPLCCGP